MILTMDIGNTNIKVALFEGRHMCEYWRVATSRTYSSDEYGIILSSMFANKGVKMGDVRGIIISSVVPTINFTIEHMCQNYFHMDPMWVIPGVKTGINIKYENPRELGSDRIANAVASYTLYGGPCIYIDFGTATSFGVVSKDAEFLGGCICPGLKVASEALTNGTAKLPHVELVRPERVINKTTISNIQSGLIYGYVGQVQFIVNRMKDELGQNAKVIATGGLARLIAPDSKVIDEIDGSLTLKGLEIIYERNLA